jgi:hypothetical protein
MDKTLRSNFIGKSKKAEIENTASEDIISLMQEMKSFLKDAANELLQPRKEAVEKLLQKVHH